MKEEKNKTNNTEREVKFLKDLHQAAQMGRDTLEHINSNIKDGDLKEAVERDISDYIDIGDQITKKLEKHDAHPKPVRKIPQMMAGMMIDMRINDDTADSEIAKMIIDGTTKGVTECTAKISAYSDLNDDVKNLGYKFLWIQQKNIDEMRRFLTID